MTGCTPRHPRLRWTQFRCHDGLSKSYSLAAHALAFRRAEVEDAADERAFRKAVDDTESAVSREHTMWMAKPGVTSCGQSRVVCRLCLAGVAALLTNVGVIRFAASCERPALQCPHIRGGSLIPVIRALRSVRLS